MNKKQKEKDEKIQYKNSKEYKRVEMLERKE